MNINEIIFYLTSRYLIDNRDQITCIRSIPSQRDVPSFDAVSEELKAISKSMRGDEDLSLKNRFLSGGWISIAGKAYKHDQIMKVKNLPQRFDDWIYRECVAPKLLNCRLNMTYFLEN